MKGRTRNAQHENGGVGGYARGGMAMPSRNASMASRGTRPPKATGGAKGVTMPGVVPPVMGTQPPAQPLQAVSTGGRIGRAAGGRATRGS